MVTAQPMVPDPPVPRRGPGRPRKEEIPRRVLPSGPVPSSTPVPSDDRFTAMGTHLAGFIHALLTMGRAEKPAEVGVLTPNEVARMIRAREAEVREAITKGKLRAVAVGRSWRTTVANVRTWPGGG